VFSYSPVNLSMRMSEGLSSCGPVFFLIKEALREATVDLREREVAREMEWASY